MHFLSIQSIFFEPSDKQVCKIVFIEIAHQEMGIAFDPYFGQFYQGCLSAVAIDSFHEFASHLQARSEEHTLIQIGRAHV